jgi:hypothetical protein
MAGRSLTVVRHGALVERPDGAVVSLRQSSVVELGERRLLNATQVEAAFLFRNAWSAALEPAPRPVSPFERRDRGAPSLADVERAAEAKKALRRCKALLGVRGFDLVARICGDGYHIRDLCKSRRERDTMTDLLRMHLSDVAEVFDLH